MATRQFADLSAYRRNVNNAQAGANLLESLMQGVQGGIQLQQLPGKLQENQIAQQLQNAINLQKLQDLQNPQAAMARNLQNFMQEAAIKQAITNPNSGIMQTPAGLVGETIATPQAIPQTANALEAALQANPNMAIPTAAPRLPITPIGVGGIQSGLSIDQNVPFQAQEDELNRSIRLANSKSRGTSNLQFRTVGNNLIGLDPATGAEVSRISIDPAKQRFSTSRGVYEYDPANPDGGRILPGTEPSAKPSDLTPSQRISAKREIRSTYDELPAKIDYFGKGQVTGSYQLKTRLDAVLDPVKGDFSKLNPQAKQTFVFAINKLRDPTSATLLAEASQIADKAGIGQRFNAFIANYKEGDPLPDQVAKEIYDVISQVAAVHKENLIIELIEAKTDTDALEVNLTSIGVPKALQEEVIKRSNNPIQSAPQNTVTPAVKKNQLSSAQNFNSEAQARAAGFNNGDMVIINGQAGHLQ